ncbi:Hypothetical predicted protein [Octopus vulgaris]|uniref:Uncharacterized protein n=1 Tax=Octopus vulgaris TaxID=6645 RepID=A0AA36AVD6_OCTVU|nr:Hypothetical predicted protein [Octopus vulgaris]
MIFFLIPLFYILQTLIRLCPSNCLNLRDRHKSQVLPDVGSKMLVLSQCEKSLLLLLSLSPGEVALLVEKAFVHIECLTVFSFTLNPTHPFLQDLHSPLVTWRLLRKKITSHGWSGVN